MKYQVGQILPINIEGFMGIEIPCEAKIVDTKYVLRADFNDGQFSEMSLSENELNERIIENPQSVYKNGEKSYYQPLCQYGYGDCVCDPAYIREYYPDWYKELGCPTICESCENGNEYDDEDK